MKFKIGHFAVLQNTSVLFQHLEGQKVEILSDLTPQIVTDPAGAERMVSGYEILLADGTHLVAQPDSLAPVIGTREMDQIVSWDDCAWRPIPGMVKRLEALSNSVKAARRLS